MTAARTTCPFGRDFDFTDPDVLAHGVPVAEFAELRKTAPVWWNEQPPGATVFDDGGYWVISRHEDIKAISRNNDVWSTNAKGAVMRMPDGTTPDQLDLTKALLINHDAPAHTRLRKLVSRLFSPAQWPGSRRSSPEQLTRSCAPRQRRTQAISSTTSP